ncbi:hypothetical protein [Lysobacter sp. D1-1-M9]|uniref:hypothetical protein n=1 Tax=Novilysobacter longmucuonensis TaxID=3098603 RepID=UPI002FCB8970
MEIVDFIGREIVQKQRSGDAVASPIGGLRILDNQSQRLTVGRYRANRRIFPLGRAKSHEAIGVQKRTYCVGVHAAPDKTVQRIPMTAWKSLSLNVFCFKPEPEWPRLR